MEKTINSEILRFCERIKTLGFRVYLAERGYYGYITEDGSRVLSFSFSDCGSLSGNYGPPTSACGTGWRMDTHPSDLRAKQDVHAALYASPPLWIRGQWKYLTSEKQYLAMYQESSKFKEV